MKLLFPIATMLVGFLILGQTALAAQSIIKVGVLAPDRGLQSWLGDQIGAGAKFAIDQEQMNDCKSTIGPNLTIIAIGGPLLDEVGVEQAVDSLMGSGVDVIIGGSTRSDATILRSVVSDRNIPTILLAESQSAKSNPHVLQMVLSQENVYRVAFGKWLDVVEDINSYSVVYAENNAMTQKYAAAIAPQLLQEHGIDSEYYKIPYESTRKPQYEGVIEKVNDISSDALILSGPAFDIDNLVHEAAVALEVKPKSIYVALPSGLEQKDLSIADYGYSPVYFGAQFWPDNSNPCTNEFVEGVRSHLKWPDDAPASTLAIKTYDAVQVVREAWKDGVFGGWDTAQSVQGITGPLMLQDDKVTMAGPTRLIVSDPQVGVVIEDAWIQQ